MAKKKGRGHQTRPKEIKRLEVKASAEVRRPKKRVTKKPVATAEAVEMPSEKTKKALRPPAARRAEAAVAAARPGKLKQPKKAPAVKATPSEAAEKAPRVQKRAGGPAAAKTDHKEAKGKELARAKREPKKAAAKTVPSETAVKAPRAGKKAGKDDPEDGDGWEGARREETEETCCRREAERGRET
jgi:hypothetical protein